jgi:hypothetical protein
MVGVIYDSAVCCVEMHKYLNKFVLLGGVGEEKLRGLSERAGATFEKQQLASLFFFLLSLSLFYLKGPFLFLGIAIFFFLLSSLMHHLARRF